ncbi:MAG: hypothetical protein JWO47_122 [Candidatus Saccharibacteria bacterium]|nr:hypothetical protein [Candidatus Saccharibacteria bacterium]
MAMSNEEFKSSVYSLIGNNPVILGEDIGMPESILAAVVHTDSNHFTDIQVAIESDPLTLLEGSSSHGHLRNVTGTYPGGPRRGASAYDVYTSDQRILYVDPVELHPRHGNDLGRKAILEALRDEVKDISDVRFGGFRSVSREYISAVRLINQAVTVAREAEFMRVAPGRVHLAFRLVLDGLRSERYVSPAEAIRITS